MSTTSTQIVGKEVIREEDTVTLNFTLNGHHKKCVVTQANNFTKTELQNKVLKWIDEETVKQNKD